MKNLRTRLPVGGKGREMTRIFPNGEVVIFRQKIRQSAHLIKKSRRFDRYAACAIARMFLFLPQDPLDPYRAPWFFCALFMGLSLVRNFDIAANPEIMPNPEDRAEYELLKYQCDCPSVYEVTPVEKPTVRYGLKGITRRGARTVRCAAHLMQKTYGRGRLTFATVTVPNLPRKELRLVHERWNEIVEIYRLYIRRDLERHNLRGEILSVSEIQDKRQKKTGVPVLHLHSLWVGRLPYGGWAISTERHDDIWRKAIQAVVPEVRVSFKSAANLQEVRTSASAYLGKYMTKSGPAIASAKDSGFADWLPRQWWNCSRSLKEWVEAETVESVVASDFLLDAARANDKSVWEFYGEIGIDIGWSHDYWLASFGRLTAEVADGLRRALGWKEQRKSERKGLAFVT